MRTEKQREAAKIRRERRARGEYKWSAEAREKQSKATSGENHPLWGKTHTDDAKTRMSQVKLGENNPMSGKAHTGVTKAKMSEAASGEKNHNYGKTHPAATCQKNSESCKKSFQDRQWYGSVTYPDPDRYCILFNTKFKARCRAYWGYKSILSGKTQAENLILGKPVKLSVHHVYYQKKACCEWDEDLQGYYAMINLGIKSKPNMVRHNIKGDPNKFVILTNSEHAVTNTNKLYWIKLFEDLIEKQGGKCYLTKEEMVGYKK
jgi:hypothetical protein